MCYQKFVLTNYINQKIVLTSCYHEKCFNKICINKKIGLTCLFDKNCETKFISSYGFSIAVLPYDYYSFSNNF